MKATQAAIRHRCASRRREVGAPKAMAEETKLEITGRKRRVMEGVNLVVYTAIVIAIVVVVNVAVNRYGDRRWDLTSNKKFSLSSQSIKVLKGLDRNVDIYAFDRPEGFRGERDLLDNYTNVTRRVTAHYLDPIREPALAAQLGINRLGKIVVAAGPRHFEAQTSDEQGVTNALIRLLEGEKKVCFIEGHGERDLENADRDDGFQQFKKGLTDQNNSVETLTLLTGKSEIPADCAEVIIAGPQHDYDPPEIDVLRKYVTEGGRLFAMLDAGVDLPNLAKLFVGWGVTPQDDLVADPSIGLVGGGVEDLVIKDYGSSPIVEPIKRTLTLFPLTRSFELRNDNKAGVSDDTLCQTTSDGYGWVGYRPKIEETPSYRAGKDLKGPVPVAVSGTLTGSDPKKQGRFIVLGTSLIAANAYLGFRGNQDLLMNMVDWLTAEEDLLSIRPKPPEAQHLDLNAQQMRRILFLGIFGLPILIIAMGVSVWWQRRR